MILLNDVNIHVLYYENKATECCQHCSGPPRSHTDLQSPNHNCFQWGHCWGFFTSNQDGCRCVTHFYAPIGGQSSNYILITALSKSKYYEESPPISIPINLNKICEGLHLSSVLFWRKPPWHCVKWSVLGAAAGGFLVTTCFKCLPARRVECAMFRVRWVCLYVKCV